MRIAIDARYVADHFPGIGRYVFNLVRELAALTHPHTLLVLHNSALLNRRYDLAALAGPRVELVEVAARPFTLREQFVVPRMLRRLRANVYHAPYYVRPYLPLPCPSVTTLYDLIPRFFPAEVSPRARLLFDVLTRQAICSSQHVLAISKHTRNDVISAYRVPAAQVTVTPLAVDSRFCPQTPDVLTTMRQRYDLPQRYVLSLSSNKPHKNLETLVRAWAAVIQHTDEVKLVIAGHWDARYPQARAVAEHLGISERVQFLHNVAEIELPALYAGAEVFAFPSLYEGFGLPPLEALACGVPVVCGDMSSVPEVVGGAALRCDVRDATALSAALLRLLGDPPFRAELRARGLAQAAQFSWAATAAATLAVYEKVLNSQG